MWRALFLFILLYMRLSKTSLVLATALLPLFSACGDDDSGSAPHTSDNHGTLENYASVEDLPECSSERLGELAKVKASYYACFADAWTPVDDFAAGVCNIMACDKDVEGDVVYVEAEATAYRCESGTWKNSSGKMFSDSAFVDCFISAILTAKVNSEDKLSNCTEKREGDLAYVSDNLYACTSKKWVEQQSLIISESDLGKCSDERNVYVLSKMASYACKGGQWFKAGSALSPSTESSSSSEQGGSSAKPTSSSSDTAVVVPNYDSTKVRGVCVASKSSAMKGESVSYTFYNMGGTPVTFTWSFDEDASESISGEVVPSVSYSRGGMHRAILVVNDGMESSSGEIVCSGVKVEGKPIAGCECKTETVSSIVHGITPAEAEWKVSGCTGEGPFTYEWDNGATGTDSVAVGKTIFYGKYAPTVTITNADGESMEPQCNEITAAEPTKAYCAVNASYFEIEGISGPTNQTPSIDVVIVSGGDSVAKTIKASVSSTCHYVTDYGYVCGDVYRWDWVHELIPLSSVGYSKYTLLHEGDTVCVTSLATCGAEANTLYKGMTATWNLMLGEAGVASAKTYSWTFTDDDENVLSTSTDAAPQMELNDYGTIMATLVVDKGLPTENTIGCSDVDVVRRPITGCSCTAELLSESNDLSEVESVSYAWTLSGCKSEGAEPLTYIWDEDYTQDAEDSLKVTRTFAERGKFSPSVSVKNQEGANAVVLCAPATVKNSEQVAENEFEDLRDGKIYKTVVIGEQTWMAENLDYDTTGAKCFENSLDSCARYGRLYPVNLAQVVCPDGWHLPNQTEFTKLLDTVDGFENLKAAEWGGEDPYGFSALPAGKNDVIAGEYTKWQFITGWWINGSWGDELFAVYGDSGQAAFDYDDSVNGFSVRCIMD